MFRSFFTKARDGQFVFAESEDLWRLLSNITVTKVLRQVQRNRRGKRSIDLEESLMAPGTGIRIPAEFVISGPSPTHSRCQELLDQPAQQAIPRHRACGAKLCQQFLQGADGIRSIGAAAFVVELPKSQLGTGKIGVWCTTSK